MRALTCLAVLGAAVCCLHAAEKKVDYTKSAPFAKSEELPDAKVDDLTLRKWRFIAKDLDWSLERSYAGRDYVLRLAYPKAGAKPSKEGASIYLDEYNLCLPLGGWIPPEIGAKAKAVSFSVRPETQASHVVTEVQTRQAKCLAGDAFCKRTPFKLRSMKIGEWTEMTVTADLVRDNRLADIAFLVRGAQTNSVCAFAVADVKIVCSDGTEWDVVNAREPRYADGAAAIRPTPSKRLPTRPRVQLGLCSWDVLARRGDLARIGAWGEKYCPEFDLVLSISGSAEPSLATLTPLLPENLFLQFQRGPHAYTYAAIFNALPRNEFGAAQNFAFNSVIATHPLIRRALDEQIDYVATHGIRDFQGFDYVWLYKNALWGYDPASVAAFREDLLGRGAKLVLSDGRTMDFAGYYRAYHGDEPRPADFGFASWDAYAPDTKAEFESGDATMARRFELFAMMRNYEWLLQAQRFNDCAAKYGKAYDYLLNGESWVNGNDHLFLLKLKNTGTVSPEYFSFTPKYIECKYHELGLFVREAARRGKRFGMTVETSRGGGNSQPYWSPNTGFAICYALTGIGLKSFHYDHVPVCSIWSRENYLRYSPRANDAFAKFTERHLLGDMRGYRRAMLDGATRPDSTCVLVLGRRPVSREPDRVRWAATLDRLGYDYAVTDMTELPDLIDGARVVFAGSDATRPGTRELLAKWKAGGEGRLLFENPEEPDLAARLASLGLPRKRAVKSDDSAIALRFGMSGCESAVLFDRKAVETADRNKWYNEVWGPTFSKMIADPAKYLYFDNQPQGICRVAFDVAVNGTYRVYRYLEDREETVEVTDGTLALDNSGRFAEVCYFAPDTDEFRSRLADIKADRALTADAFRED